MQRGRRHVGVHRDAHRHAGVVAQRQLFEEDGLVRVVEPLAAVLRIVTNAEQAELPHFRIERAIETPHLVELARARRQLGLMNFRTTSRNDLCSALP
jgi:hypothetical protein